MQYIVVASNPKTRTSKIKGSEISSNLGGGTDEESNDTTTGLCLHHCSSSGHDTSEGLHLAFHNNITVSINTISIQYLPIPRNTPLSQMRIILSTVDLSNSGASIERESPNRKYPANIIDSKLDQARQGPHMRTSQEQRPDRSRPSVQVLLARKKA